MSIDPHWVFENHKEAARLIESLQRERDALAAHLGEPVAYISHTSEGDVLGWERQFDAPRHTSLYTAPQPASSLARLKALWLAGGGVE